MSDILIQVKRTDVSGRTPNTTNSANLQYIEAGELALNMADKRLFSSNGSVLIEVGANLTSLNVTGGNTHLGGLIGGESLRVTSTTNSNNYLQIAGSITGSAPTLSAQGVDTNVGITLAAKGSGVVNVNALLNVVSSLQVNSTFVANSTVVKILANDILTFNDTTTQNTAFRVYNESGTRIA